jgi:hypothetical protein
LIALQINNWNIANKNKILEAELLKGIQTDLVSDTLQIRNRFYPSYFNLKKNIAAFDSVLKLEDPEIDMVYLDSIFQRCIRQRNTFWPSTGTYQNIVNTGISNIFRNKILYKGIQNIYDKSFAIILAAGERIDDYSDQNRRKFNYTLVLPESERIKFYRDPNTRNEVAFWFQELKHFESLIDFNKNFARELLLEIETELDSH